ncbi:MAG: hypothetical protein KIT78_00885 [Steroidobacteraceae bacterium]|jgi:hypothetical protein|nr:hypothetical protein [Steroidobacteraceae bacterium]
MRLLRHALRPARPVALLLIATLTLLLSLASFAGFLGWPLAIIVLSWLFKYAYVLLDLSAEGIAEPPVLSAEMVNPVEQRPLMQLAICGAGFGLAWWIGGAPGYAIGAAFLVLLPATAAVLGVTGSAIEALNPLTLARVIRGLGSAYLVLLAATITFAAAIYGLEHLPVWGAVKTAAAQWLLLSLFSLIGGAIYERRQALGHEPQVSPERTADREERERVRRRERMLEDAYVPARIHEPHRVVEPMSRWLDAAGDAQLETDACAFLARAANWNDPRTYSLVAQLVISRLIAARKFSLALERFEAARRVVPDLAMASPADARVLIQHARATGRARLAERLEAEAARS